MGKRHKRTCLCFDCLCKSGSQRSERGSRGRHSGAGRVAEGVVTAVTAFSGLIAEPPSDQIYDAEDAYEQARYSLSDGDNRDKYLDEQTRAANDRKGGSGRQR